MVSDSEMFNVEFDHGGKWLLPYWGYSVPSFVVRMVVLDPISRKD